MMSPMMQNCADEISETLRHHGIKNYVVLIKDPAGDDEGTLFGGSYAWALGRMELMNFEIKRAWADTMRKMVGGS